MLPNEHIQVLITKHLYGSLEASEHTELCAWLEASKDHVDAFVREVFVFHQAGEWLRGEDQRKAIESIASVSNESKSNLGLAGDLSLGTDDALDEWIAEAIQNRKQREASAEAADASNHPAQAKPIGTRLPWLESDRPRGPINIVIPRWAACGGIAAGLMLLVVLATDTNTPQNTTPPVASADPIHATLKATYRSQWDEQTPLANNAAIGSNWVSLKAGMARFETAKGNSVLVEGPARFQMRGPNKMQLLEGRLVADVTPEGTGFTVITPNATIVDKGTSFGVDVDNARNTRTHVFDGLVLQSATASGAATTPPIAMHAGESTKIDAAGQYVASETNTTDRFIQWRTFEALRGNGDGQALVDAMDRMWSRDAKLIAATAFLTADPMHAHGMQTRPIEGDWQVVENSLAQGNETAAPAQDGHLVVNASQTTTLFFDIDLSPNSPAAQAGLVRAEDNMLGKDGTRLCLSWTVVLDTDAPTPARDAWCGLSLFAGSDAKRAGGQAQSPGEGEYCFFGRPAELSGWGITRASAGPNQTLSRINKGLIDQPSKQRIQPKQVVRWLVVMDFKPGPDQMAVYIDSHPDGLQTPDLVVDDLDLRFDRLRIKASGEDLQWSFDDIRLGTDVPSALRH